MTEARNPYWDNIKGILIILVVLGHFLWAYWGLGLAGYIVTFIYLFHMPAFIFVSGYLSRSANSRSLASVLKLLVTYLAFNTCMMVFSLLMSGTALQLITPYHSYWYLPSLMVWRLAVGHLEKAKGIMAIGVVVAILIGFWSDITNVLAISRTVAFFPFFIIGFKASEWDKFLERKRPSDYLKGASILVIALLLAIVVMYRFPLSKTDLLMDTYSSLLGPFVRMLIFCIAGLMIMSITVLTPRRPIPFLCKWGKNSLAIYTLHRFVTLIFERIFSPQGYSGTYVSYAALATLCTLFVLGSDKVAQITNRMVSALVGALTPFGSDAPGNRRLLVRRVAAGVLAGCFLLPVVRSVTQVTKTVGASESVTSDAVHPVMSLEMQQALDDSLSIAFVGDLILLQDQVRNAYSDETGQYDFSPMFEYAARYLSEADLAIGVFEGPTAGEEAGYSTSNFDDDVPLCLNYPDSFVNAVKDSGIDLVSTANNHLLDQGTEGSLRTLDILDSAGLLHVGSYRSHEEKGSVVAAEVGGVRIAFLAYTYGSNNYDEEYFFRENTSITSALAAPGSRYFAQAKAAVQSDFQALKDMRPPPDVIVVIPHMGTQFSHETDDYQDTWNDIFIEAGAYIILGDHAHAVQPIEFRESAAGRKKAIIVNCPGNFANSYVEHDGDATSIIEIYVHPDTKEIVCAAVIPMYTHSPSNGNYRALPIYSIMTDPILQNEISVYEMKRVSEAQSIVTTVMLGADITLDQVQERYYLYPKGYVRQPTQAIEVTKEMKASPLYRLLAEAETVCFVGDSITAGSENGGYGWYEPLAAAFPGITVSREAWASATTITLLKNADSISGHHADLYVIAIGTNDVRYRDKRTCSMNATAYVANVDSLIQVTLGESPNASFALISPWLAQDNDLYTKVPVEERDELLRQYGTALKAYCEEEGFCFVDPNPALDEVLTKDAPSKYLLDHIHPNAAAGIRLYSEKVLSSSH